MLIFGISFLVLDVALLALAARASTLHPAVKFAIRALAGILFISGIILVVSAVVN
jgi:hypothetical protein